MRHHDFGAPQRGDAARHPERDRARLRASLGQVDCGENTTIDLTLGLQVGKVYEGAVFQAERQEIGSSYRLTMHGFLTARSACASVCGDGYVTPEETCDAGKRCVGGSAEGTACATSTDCPGGTCTSQNAAYGICNATCSGAGASCGDGTHDVGHEACDLGTAMNTGAYNGCDTDCTLGPRCGDGVRDQGHEACDLGTELNIGGYGGCNADCTLASACGDGTVQLDEACDLGTTTNTGTYGGCNANCTRAAFCGDGTPNIDHEACDLGTSSNTGTYGGCNADCTQPSRCGDGVRDSDHEACDLGAEMNDGRYGGCASDCTLAAYCGDGVLDVGEACDDGVLNTSAGPCTASCQQLFAIGGTISGLPMSASVTLANIGSSQTFTANGSFTFSALANAYNVTVTTQPTGARCTVSNGVGSATAAVSTIGVSCVASGSLDTSFGGGLGWLRLEPTDYDNEWYAIAIDSDDSIALAGRNQVFFDEDWIVSKLTASGVLDAQFGTGGHFGGVPGSAPNEKAKGIVATPSGFAVAGHWFESLSGADLSVLQLTETGSLDAGYATNGRATYAGASYEYAEAMHRYADGSVLVVGRMLSGASADMHFARFTPEGQLDASFDGDGVMTYGVPNIGDEALGLAVGSDGAIYVVGFSGGDSVILKLTASGSFDPDFGDAGVLILDLAGGARLDQLRKVQLGQDGTLVVAGYADNGTDNDMVVARYRTDDGAPAAGFGSSGVVYIDDTGDDEAYALRLTPEGKILAGGKTGDEACLVRLHETGTIDTGFAMLGFFRHLFSGTSAHINDIAIDSQGRIVIAGSWATDTPDLGAARLHP